MKNNFDILIFFIETFWKTTYAKS